MAGLVQHAHDGRHEVVLVVARGDAHVIGHAAEEGVQRDVEAAMLEIEADGGHEAAGQRLLLLAREGSLRSEEHTSELQSLMRHSYDVFCLKSKNNMISLCNHNT